MSERADEHPHEERPTETREPVRPPLPEPEAAETAQQGPRDAGPPERAPAPSDWHAGHAYPPPPGYPPGYSPPPGYPPSYVIPTRTNGFAIASLVLGIVWIYWIGSILALVFGYIAKRQIDRSQGHETGRGMAIAGIVLGWIGVAILLLVIAFVIAAVASGDWEGDFGSGPYY